jgi:large subunit ribosomal protein L22
MSKPEAGRKVGEREALATATTVRGSAYKLNLVAGLIRGRKAGEAVTLLGFSKKAMAEDVQKCLKSAIANAENNHNLDVDQLWVKEASVGKSISMKRFATRARGRSARIVKPFSRIRIVVEERDTAVQAGE